MPAENKTVRGFAHAAANWDGYPRCARWRHGPTCDQLYERFKALLLGAAREREDAVGALTAQVKELEHRLAEDRARAD